MYSEPLSPGRPEIMNVIMTESIGLTNAAQKGDLTEVRRIMARPDIAQILQHCDASFNALYLIATGGYHFSPGPQFTQLQLDNHVTIARLILNHKHLHLENWIAGHSLESLRDRATYVLDTGTTMNEDYPKTHRSILAHTVIIRGMIMKAIDRRT